jgi:hypothetical protein
MPFILVIDDERDFAVGEDVTVQYVRNSKDALHMLAKLYVNQYKAGHNYDLDALMLDHDLGGEDDINVVVDFLILIGPSESKNPFRVKKIYVHTMNPVGADRVVNKLKAYGYDVDRVSLPKIKGER